MLQLNSKIMDIKFFVPYLEAKRHLDIHASIIGRWLEAGLYEDRRGNGNWSKAPCARRDEVHTVQILDFKNRHRVIRTDVQPGRRCYPVVEDIDLAAIPDLRDLPYVPDTLSVQWDAATQTYYEIGNNGLLSVRRGTSDYLDYRFNRRSGELVLPDSRMLVMRLTEDEMWVMDHDQYGLEYPTIERYRRLKV